MAWNLPITQESAPIIMYRVFDITVHTNRVTLTGAFGNEWEGTELIGRCGGDKTRYDGVLQALRSGYVMKRGTGPVDTRQKCIDHLRDGECTCGVWGYKTVERLKRDGYLTAGGAAFDPDCDALGAHMFVRADVLAAVRAWGVVLEGEYGWRASAARVEYLWVPPRILHVSTQLPATAYYCNRSVRLTCDNPGVHIDPAALLEVLCERYGVRGQVGGPLPA